MKWKALIAIGAVLAIAVAILWSSSPERNVICSAIAPPTSVTDVENAPLKSQRASDWSVVVNGSRQEPILAKSLSVSAIVRLTSKSDGQPVSLAPFRVTSGASTEGTGWQWTDSHGEARLTIGAARFVQLEAPGYQAAALSLPESGEVVQVALTPSSGLWGRVILGNGSPAPNAYVRLVRQRLIVPRIDMATQARPAIQISRSEIEVASVRSNTDGTYHIPCDNYAILPSLKLVGVSESGARGEMRVTLPRESETLPDLVLGLAVGMVKAIAEDAAGAPIQGAIISNGEPASQGTVFQTDEHGCAILPNWTSSTRYRAAYAGVYAVGTPAASPSGPFVGAEIIRFVFRDLQRVPLILLDSETASPVSCERLTIMCAECESSAEERIVTSDGGGVARVPVVFGVADSVSLVIQVPGYLTAACEVRRIRPIEEHPIKVRLIRDAGTFSLRGTVVLDATPVPGVALEMICRLNNSNYPRQMTATDPDGRFAFRGCRWPGDAMVSISPRPIGGRLCGAIGPVTLDSLRDVECQLELERPLRIPAVFLGGRPGVPYCYSVSAVGSDGVPEVCLQGVPVRVHDTGSQTVCIDVLPHRSSLIAVGATDGSRAHPIAGAVAEFDPSVPGSIPVFDVSAASASLRGRVIGVTTASSELFIGIGSGGGSTTELIPIGSDYQFDCGGVAAGRWMLFLMSCDESTSSLLACRTVDVQGDLVCEIGPDPASLPVAPIRER